MNKLDVPNGGMPLDGDDFNWIHAGILEAFKGASYPFVFKYSGNCIMAGVSISYVSGQAVLTEGYVVIGYEVCYCPAQTVTVSSLANSSLKIVESYDPAGLEAFADQVSKDTYMRRRAIVSDTLNGSDEIVLENPPRVYGDEGLSSYLQGNWVVKSGFDLKAFRLSGQVTLRGAIDSGDTNLSALLLPSYLRPSKDHYFTVPLPNFSVENCILKVGADGNIIPFTSGQQTVDSGAFLSLDSVTYFL